MASLGLGVWSFHSRADGRESFASDSAAGFARGMQNMLPLDVFKNPRVAMVWSLEIPVLTSVSGARAIYSEP